MVREKENNIQLKLRKSIVFYDGFDESAVKPSVQDQLDSATRHKTHDPTVQYH